MLPFRPKTDRSNGHAAGPTDAGKPAVPVRVSPPGAVRAHGSPGRHHHLQDRLLRAIAGHPPERSSEPEVREELRRLVDELSAEQTEPLSPRECDDLVQQVLDEVFGYGPLERYLRDHEITDILVNGPRQLFVEKRGQLHPCDAAFRDEGHLLQIIQRMLGSTGRRLDAKSPMVDAHLPDGSRVNAVIKPPALNGPLVSIRRFGSRPLTVDDLLANGSLAQEMLDFLAACVQSKINMIVSGGTGSGKTTLLNALSRYIPGTERVVTIEDTAELDLQQPHVAKMEAQPADLEGWGEVTMRDLVRNSLRMRPDRILIGECRGAEALEMLQAMNTGHEGSLTTIHANSTREALTRVELMIGLAGVDVPIWSVRKLIASSINVVVQVARLLGGQRKVVAISEITGMEGDMVSMHDLFEFVQTGVDRERNAEGYFRVTGMRPKCLGRMNTHGAGLGFELFQERRLQVPRHQEAVR